MVTQLRFLLPFLGLTLLSTAPLKAQFQDPDCNDCACAIGNGPNTATTLVNNTVGSPLQHDNIWPTFGSSNTWSNANLFNGRFHRFSLVGGNRYTFSLCGANTANTVMYIAAGTGAPLGCDNDGCGDPNGPSILTFVPPGTANAFYRLFVYDGTCGNWFVNPASNFSLTVTMQAPDPLPVNDEPCGAVALPITGPNCVLTNTNSQAATLSVISGTGTAPSCVSPSLLQNDVWFSTTVPPSGLIGISTSESGSLCAGAFNLYTASACNGTFTQLTNSCALGGATGPATDPALVYDAVAAGLSVGDVVYIRYWERNGNENGTFQICAYEAERPPNDEPCGAIALPVNVGCTFSNYSNANATPVSTVITNPDPVTAACGGPAGNDMWFAVTVTADMVANGFVVNTNSGTITNMAMTWYRLVAGTACGPGTMQQIACNNNQAAANEMPRINSGPAGILPVLGETIYIRIWANTPWEGTFGICATVNQPPPNNLPCGAIPLTAQYGCLLSTYSNENAFNTPPNFGQGNVAAPTCQANWNNDVWFTVVMPPNGVIQIDTQAGSMVNSGMAIYSATGTCGGGNLNLTQLACQNAGSQQGSLQMPYISYTNVGLAGQTLYIRVWRQGNQTAGNPDGNFGLCARRTDAPPGNCFYTLTLNDSAGDGWDGSFVTVCIGANCTNYTVNGATASVNIGVTIGQTMTVSYTGAGGFQNQNSYSMTLFGQPKYISGSPPPQGLVWAETVTCEPPPAPQSDCIGAFTLCSQNILVNQAPTNTGGVVDLNFGNRGCFNNNERQGLWYVWTVQESGNLAFTVYPQPWPVPAGTPFTIFDWAIWGPYAGLTCPPPGPPIRCNWASVFAPKGMQYNNALPTSVGGAGPAMIRHLPVLAGEVYTLYVDNWGMTGLNFSIEWHTTTDPLYQPMASVDCIILPVDMIGFDVQAMARTVDVTWRTVSEHNSAYFDVERSADGVNFLTIGRVAAAGNSENLIDYAFVDDAPLEGVSFYRLRRVDQNDRADHTDAKQVMFRRGVASIELFPNPATNEIQVLYELPQEGIVLWRILDASGRFVLEGNDAGDRGRNRMEIPVARLDQGSYILELRDGQGHPQGVARFVKH